MANYRVVKPVSFVKGDKVVHYQRGGEVVDIAKAQADPLVAEGRLEPVDEPKAENEPKSVEKKTEAKGDGGQN